MSLCLTLISISVPVLATDFNTFADSDEGFDTKTDPLSKELTLV